MDNARNGHEEVRFKAAKALMMHLVADQKNLTHAWMSGNVGEVHREQAHSKNRLKSTADLFCHMKTGETRIAHDWIKGNQKKAQDETAQSRQEILSAKTLDTVKAKGTESWGADFLHNQQQAQALGGQVSGDIVSSFQTLVTQATQGQNALAEAATYIGKAIIKDVLDSVASTLMNKGELQLALGASLLAGIVTAALAPDHLIAGGMMMAAGTGLQMMTASLLAEGALVVKPTLAVVGEGGQPEAVIPASRFAEFGLTGGLQVSKLRMSFPNMQSLSDANHPDFISAVSGELQAAYQAANQGKN